MPAPSATPPPTFRRPIRAVIALVPLALSMLALAACGESAQEKAQKTVCSARTDINTQIEHIRSLTVSTQAPTELKEAGNAIKADLKKISESQKDLAPSRRTEVEQATSSFGKEVEAILGSIGIGSLLEGKVPSSAKTSLTSAAERLGQSYKQSLEPIKCT
jgi:Tfp pilus assembly protein PilP